MGGSGSLAAKGGRHGAEHTALGQHSLLGELYKLLTHFDSHSIVTHFKGWYLCKRENGSHGYPTGLTGFCTGKEV